MGQIRTALTVFPEGARESSRRVAGWGRYTLKRACMMLVTSELEGARAASMKYMYCQVQAACQPMRPEIGGIKWTVYLSSKHSPPLYRIALHNGQPILHANLGMLCMPVLALIRAQCLKANVFICPFIDINL